MVGEMCKQLGPSTMGNCALLLYIASISQLSVLQLGQNEESLLPWGQALWQIYQSSFITGYEYYSIHSR